MLLQIKDVVDMVFIVNQLNAGPHHELVNRDLEQDELVNRTPRW